MLAALCPVVLGCKDIERILTTAGDPPRAVVSAVATLRFGLDLVRRALLGQAAEPAAGEEATTSEDWARPGGAETRPIFKVAGRSSG